MKKKIKIKKKSQNFGTFSDGFIENLDVDSDTTLNLIQEALKRNIEVWVGSSKKSLSYSNGKASITAKKIINKDLNFSKPKI